MSMIAELFENTGPISNTMIANAISRDVAALQKQHSLERVRVGDPIRKAALERLDQPMFDLCDATMDAVPADATSDHLREAADAIEELAAEAVQWLRDRADMQDDPTDGWGA